MNSTTVIIAFAVLSASAPAHSESGSDIVGVRGIESPVHERVVGNLPQFVLERMSALQHPCVPVLHENPFRALLEKPFRVSELPAALQHRPRGDLILDFEYMTGYFRCLDVYVGAARGLRDWIQRSRVNISNLPYMAHDQIERAEPRKRENGWSPDQSFQHPHVFNYIRSSVRQTLDSDIELTAVDGMMTMHKEGKVWHSHNHLDGAKIEIYYLDDDDRRLRIR